MVLILVKDEKVLFFTAENAECAERFRYGIIRFLCDLNVLCGDSVSLPKTKVLSLNEYNH